MKKFLGSIGRGIQRIGFLPCALVILAIIFFLGATYSPWVRTPAEVVRYNQAVDGIYASYSYESLDIFQSLWHEAQSITVREASAYNFGTLLGNSQDPRKQMVALQAFLDAVRMNPHDEYAKSNMEILLRRIAKQEAGSGTNGQPHGGNDKSQGTNNGPQRQPGNGYGNDQSPSGF